MPKRIQLSRKKGWKMPPNTVKVDRTTKWGNRWRVSGAITAEEAVFRFREEVTGDALAAALYRGLVTTHLAGKDLACWCKIGEPCHADVLIELANQ